MVHGTLACVRENVFTMRSICKCAIRVYAFFYFSVSVYMHACTWCVRVSVYVFVCIWMKGKCVNGCACGSVGV